MHTYSDSKQKKWCFINATSFFLNILLLHTTHYLTDPNYGKESNENWYGKEPNISASIKAKGWLNFLLISKKNSFNWILGVLGINITLCTQKGQSLFREHLLLRPKNLHAGKHFPIKNLHAVGSQWLQYSNMIDKSTIHNLFV